MVAALLHHHMYDTRTNIESTATLTLTAVIIAARCYAVCGVHIIT